MKRKFIPVLLALILCFSFALSVSAGAKAVDFVVDEFGYLADSELDLLNEKAAEIREECGVGIFFVYTSEESLESYDVDRLVRGIEDYYVMIENDTSWYSFLGGIAEEYIDYDTEEDLRDAYDQPDTYIEGLSDFLDAAADCFPAIADTEEAERPDAEHPDAEEYVLFDEADLLSNAEEEELTEKLLDVSHTYDAQIVICTIESMDGGDIDLFLEYLYDEMGFGYGEDLDGVLLLVCMDPREYRILSNGFAGEAIDSGDIDAIGDAIVSDLSDGDYAASFDEFVDQCAYYLDGHLNGFPFRSGTNLAISLIIGIVAGLIVAFVLKGQLKTVRKQNQANVYVKQDSMNITAHSDIFLYRDVTRTKKTSSGSSSGGSSRSTGGGSF